MNDDLVCVQWKLSLLRLYICKVNKLNNLTYESPSLGTPFSHLYSLEVKSKFHMVGEIGVDVN